MGISGEFRDGWPAKMNVLPESHVESLKALLHFVFDQYHYDMEPPAQSFQIAETGAESMLSRLQDSNLSGFGYYEPEL